MFKEEKVYCVILAGGKGSSTHAKAPAKGAGGWKKGSKGGNSGGKSK